jgi:hypothetical protein
MINIVFIALIAIASFLLFLEMKVNKKQQKLIEQETADLKQLKNSNLKNKNYGLLYYRNNKQTNSSLSPNYPGKSSSAA